MNNYIEYLTTIGLSRNEALVYITLLENDLLSISDLSRNTLIHRVGLYSLLPKMLSKNLIKETMKGRQRLYQAESPERIEVLFQRIEKGFKNVIEQLKTQYENKSKKPSIQYFHGKKGYEYMFDDIALSIPKNGSYYRYSARVADEKNFEMSNLYKKAREKKGFERKVITSYKKSLLKSKRLDRSVKAIPPSVDLFDDNVSQYLYANKIAFIDHDTQSVFILNSKKIVEFQKKLFRMLWNTL